MIVSGKQIEAAKVILNALLDGCDVKGIAKPSLLSEMAKEIGFILAKHTTTEADFQRNATIISDVLIQQYYEKGGNI